jgi:hypothetical protein
MLTFCQWLEQNAGPVFATDLTNTAVEDGFQKRIRSKYMAGGIRQEKEANPDKLFGKRKRRMKTK